MRFRQVLVDRKIGNKSRRAPHEVIAVKPPGTNFNFEVNNMKKLTILLTCFNKEKYISYILHQLVSQNCEDIIVHIINDGSTDHSLEIIQEIVGDIPNFYIHSFDKNYGVGYVRQYALSLVESGYFIFIDADDMIVEDYIQTILATIAANTADIHHFLTRTYPYGITACLSHTLWDKVISIDFIRKNNIDFNKTLYYNEDIDFRQQIEKTHFKEQHYNKILYIYNLFTNDSITHKQPLWYKYGDEGLKKGLI